jgi:RNA polymerase sigma factor (sigma-70 family)
MPERYVKQVLDGDKDAFRYIIRECQDAAFNIALSILKEEFAAKDAVQQALVKAYRNLHTFRKESSFKTWFHRILVNECFLIARKKNTDRFSFRPMNQSGNKADNPVQRKQDEAHASYYIREALQLMKPDECLALQLFYLDEHSIEEIREITGWSVSKTKVTLHRARKSMKEILTGRLNIKPEELL